MSELRLLHPDSAAFVDLLTQLKSLHLKKMADYGLAHAPFHNVEGSAEWGLEPWVGAMVRASDKMRRLQKFAKVGTLTNESVEDSFMDLAAYALIALVLYRKGLVEG